MTKPLVCIQPLVNYDNRAGSVYPPRNLDELLKILDYSYIEDEGHSCGLTTNVPPTVNKNRLKRLRKKGR